MSNRRLLGFLPDRSGVLLLPAALTAAVALLGFGTLVISRGEALADQQRAREQLVEAQAQNRRLTAALEQAQNGQNIIPRAYQYFGRIPDGLTIFEGEPAESNAPPQPSAGPPWWVQLLEQVRQGLTNLRIGLE
jgi:hypothetical protein